MAPVERGWCGTSGRVVVARRYGKGKTEREHDECGVWRAGTRQAQERGKRDKRGRCGLVSGGMGAQGGEHGDDVVVAQLE